MNIRVSATYVFLMVLVGGAVILAACAEEASRRAEITPLATATPPATAATSPAMTSTPTPASAPPPGRGEPATATADARTPTPVAAHASPAGNKREREATPVTTSEPTSPTPSATPPATAPSATPMATVEVGAQRPGRAAGSGFAVSEAVEDPATQAAPTLLEPDEHEVLYTWDDGGDTRRVWLRSDLVVQPTNENTPRDAVVRGGGGESIVKSQPRHTEANSEPVFRTESGQLATLPGGVILVLDRSWDQVRVDRFFTERGIARSRVKDLTFAPNAFLVETVPGLPSLELANALAGQEGVVISSPNWRSELVLN